MPRTKNIVPSALLNLSLPVTVHTMLNARLYSELEGRVPYGAYANYISELIRRDAQERKLDLAPFTNGDPGAFIISGSLEAIGVLEKVLKGEFV